MYVFFSICSYKLGTFTSSAWHTVGAQEMLAQLNDQYGLFLLLSSAKFPDTWHALPREMAQDKNFTLLLAQRTDFIALTQMKVQFPSFCLIWVITPGWRPTMWVLLISWQQSPPEFGWKARSTCSNRVCWAYDS